MAKYRAASLGLNREIMRLVIGLLAAKAMRNSMILAFLVYLAVAFPLQAQWGNHGLWGALLLFMIARGGIQQWWYVYKIAPGR